MDRRRILEEELAKEQARLEALRQELSAAQSGQPKALDRTVRLREELGRTEGNLKALNREISSLKD
jgi:predicted  nucleic acid-binding Zn-ribbon protein